MKMIHRGSNHGQQLPNDINIIDYMDLLIEHFELCTEFCKTEIPNLSVMKRVKSTN